jgi:hypothetical protein
MLKDNAGKRHIITYSFCILVFISISSCEIDKKAKIPTYIEIDKIDLLISNPNTEGTSSHKITDAWVFIDDQIIGAFELPATVPVLFEGKRTLKIRAGIKNNGIAETRTIYPFFDVYKNDTLTLIPDNTIRINPVVKYFSTLNFDWMESFEDPGVSIDSVAPSYSRIQRTQDTEWVFEGSGSGYFYVDASHPVFKGISNEKFVLPKSGTNNYIELNFNTNIPLAVNLIANSATGQIEENMIVLNPTVSNGARYWNKIYVDLTDFITSQANASSFQVVFYTDIGAEYPSGTVYIDNVKLIHP